MHKTYSWLDSPVTQSIQTTVPSPLYTQVTMSKASAIQRAFENRFSISDSRNDYLNHRDKLQKERIQIIKGKRERTRTKLGRKPMYLHNGNDPTWYKE